MKPILATSCLLMAFALACSAEVPQRAPLTRYQKLWTQSMFTTPVVAGAGPVYNPLEDYVLLGVSGLSDGRVMATIMNKKQPTAEPIILETGKVQDGMRIQEVIEKAGEPLGTVIRVERAGTSGMVAFDERFLKIDQPSAKVNQAQRPQRPGQPGQAEAQEVAPVTPRPRIVQGGNVVAPRPQFNRNPSGGIPGVPNSSNPSVNPRRTR